MMLKPITPRAPATSAAWPSTPVPFRTLTSRLSGLMVPGGRPRNTLRLFWASRMSGRSTWAPAEVAKGSLGIV